MSRSEPIYIARTDDWPRLARELERADRMAIDLEFDRNRLRYGFQLCLMQIQVEDRTFLIDPLGEDKIHEQVFPFLEDPQKETVVFSFSEDQALLQYLGCKPRGLFDLGMAIRLLDHGQTSLASVLEGFLGVTISKESQKSDWFQRPLSDEQMNYAAQDVHHLFDLYDEVVSRAESRGVMNWIHEENRHLDARIIPPDPEDYYIRSKDRVGLDEVQWHIYKALLGVREEWARSKNRPGYRITSYDAVKQQVTDGLPRQWQDWKIHPSFKNPQHFKRWKETFEKAKAEAEELGLQKGRSARLTKLKPKGDPPKYNRFERDILMKERIDPLRKVLKERYGDEVATFLLSKRVAMDLLSGQAADMPEYRLDLIRETAESLDIELPF